MWKVEYGCDGKRIENGVRREAGNLDENARCSVLGALLVGIY